MVHFSGFFFIIIIESSKEQHLFEMEIFEIGNLKFSLYYHLTN